MDLPRCGGCGRPEPAGHAPQAAQFTLSHAALEAQANLGPLLDAELEELWIREREALSGAPRLPRGWTWRARLDVQRSTDVWVIRSTLLPVPVLENRP